MARPLTEEERATLQTYRREWSRLSPARRREAYALAYRRYRTERYCTKALPRLWGVTEAQAARIRREIDQEDRP